MPASAVATSATMSNAGDVPRGTDAETSRGALAPAVSASAARSMKVFTRCSAIAQPRPADASAATQPKRTSPAPSKASVTMNNIESAAALRAG
jgi:hypothetical protein